MGPLQVQELMLCPLEAGFTLHCRPITLKSTDPVLKVKHVNCVLLSSEEGVVLAR